MAANTSPQELTHLAYVLNREAARLDAVRDELHQMVLASHGEWEGTVADRFRVHVGTAHRQRHLEVARDRLRHAARLMMDAANDVPAPAPHAKPHSEPHSQSHAKKPSGSSNSGGGPGLSGGGEG